MLTKVQKWGNSRGIRSPKALLNEACIHVGDEVEVFVEKGRIIVGPVSGVGGRYALEALLAEMPKDYQPEALNWGPPNGKGSGR